MGVGNSVTEVHCEMLDLVLHWFFFSGKNITVVKEFWKKNRMQNVDNMYIEKSGRTNQQHHYIHSVCRQELPGLAVTEDVADKCSGSFVYFRQMNQNKTAGRGLVQYGYILYIYVYILFPFTQ